MHFSVVAALSLSGLPLAAPTATCTREQLQAAADSYIAAQIAGSSTGMTALDASVVYVENDKSVTTKTGILGTALKIDHNRTSLDTTQCATFTELIVASSSAPHIIGMQMRLTDGKITKMNSIVTKTGDWLFNATGTLNYASKEDWGIIPEAKRDTRASIQAAADAYCDVFNNKTVTVPWGTPCARLEGGQYISPCSTGIPSGVAIINRKYIIDEWTGAVDVMNDFASNLPDSHEFRIEGGKIRFCHVCDLPSGHFSVDLAADAFPDYDCDDEVSFVRLVNLEFGNFVVYLMEKKQKEHLCIAKLSWSFLFFNRYLPLSPSSCKAFRHF